MRFEATNTQTDTLRSQTYNTVFNRELKTTDLRNVELTIPLQTIFKNT